MSNNDSKENKILIIDDSKTFLLFITDLINQLPNIHLRLVQDPRDALMTAEEYAPDLILTDFEMPHLNGNELCKIFKGHPILCSTPIMMLTSNKEEDSLIKAIEFGADDYLYKGSSPEIVLIKIKGLIRYKKIIDAEIKVRQLEAVNALIATSNHEFNNALFISNGVLRKIKKNTDINTENLELIEKAIEMNKRMESLVKKLENLKEIGIVDYASNSKMLKFE
jgi:two-component system chemotaxis response regulator CheY